MEVGDKVIFIGSNETRVNWGGNDDPYKMGLVEGEDYTVWGVEVHSWHTKINLKGIDGRFNSASFEEVIDAK